MPGELDTIMGNNTVLVPSGSQVQLNRFSDVFGVQPADECPVVIIGERNEGSAAAAALRIISRATRERSMLKLHEAGADLVMSYASMGANTVINYLKGDNVLMVAEGLDIFREPVAPSLAGKTLAHSGIRTLTGCTVVSVELETEGALISHSTSH